MILEEAQRTRLDQLNAESPGLSSKVVVQDARQESSPLHSLFNWNVEEAAEAHWLSTAAQVINHYRILVEESQDPRATNGTVPKYRLVRPEGSKRRIRMSHEEIQRDFTLKRQPVADIRHQLIARKQTLEIQRLFFKGKERASIDLALQHITVAIENLVVFEMETLTN